MSQNNSGASPKHPAEKQQHDQNRAKFILNQYFTQVHFGCNEKLITHSKYCCHNPLFARISDPSDAAVEALTLGQKYEEKYLCSYLSASKNERNITSQNIEVLLELSKDNNYSIIVNFIATNFSLPTSITSFKTDKKQNTDDPNYFQGLDLCDIKKIFDSLLNLNRDEIREEIRKSITQLSNNLKYNSKTYNSVDHLKPFAFLIMNPFIHELDNRNILANVCSAIYNLNHSMITEFYNWFLNFPKEDFIQMLTNFNQFITVRILTDGNESEKYDLHSDDSIKGACAIIDLLYKVNEIKNYISYTEFYNDMINDRLDFNVDFPNLIRKDGFTFSTYPCVLDVNSKSMYLTIEHTLQQKYHRTPLGNFGYATAEDFLIFKVNRENLIQNTLDRIQQLKSRKKDDLKKELKVHFIGEEGIDQGGVKQEFFQLIVRKIFDPEFGMFKYNENTRCYWFNQDSTDVIEFELIGIILGLALYNNIILDVHFPLVIFKKLLEQSVKFEDIETIDPTIYNSLVSVRDTHDDVSDWCLYFSVSYESNFGENKTVELRKNGENILVDNQNKKEYIQLYQDYILNSSISKQWNPFFKGFRMVCDSDILKFVRPEELESLICGVEDLDFSELQNVANYDGGYSEEDTTIKNFWRVLNELSNENKKKFLSFTTGSDRVPHGGLRKLAFTITKTGDSDRLPSAHTCFNTLILPAYPSFEKLRDLLTKALTHSEGFGLK